MYRAPARELSSSIEYCHLPGAGFTARVWIIESTSKSSGVTVEFDSANHPGLSTGELRAAL